MAVAFGSVGTGAVATIAGSSSPATVSWSATSSGSDRIGIVGVFFAAVSGSGLNCTATWGGTSMTLAGQSPAITFISGLQSIGASYLFYILNPPTASSTVAVTMTSSGATLYFVTNSAVYTGVASIADVTNAGNTTTTSNTITVPNVTTGDMVVSVHGKETNAAFTAYNRTSRYTAQDAAPSTRLLMGDTTTTGSVAMTATQANQGAWGAVGMRLVQKSANTGAFFAMF